MRSFLVIFIQNSLTEILQSPSQKLAPRTWVHSSSSLSRRPSTVSNNSNFLAKLSHLRHNRRNPDPLCTRNTGDIGIRYKASFKRWREKWHLAGCGGEGRRIKASIGVREVRYGRAREKKEIAERQVGRRRPPRRRRRRRRKSAHGPRHRHGPSSSWRVLLLVDVAPVSRNSWWTSSWACNAGRRQGGG